MNLPRQLQIRIEAWNMRRLYLRDLRKLRLSSAVEQLAKGLSWDPVVPIIPYVRKE